MGIADLLYYSYGCVHINISINMACCLGVWSMQWVSLLRCYFVHCRELLHQQCRSQLFLFTFLMLKKLENYRCCALIYFFFPAKKKKANLPIDTKPSYTKYFEKKKHIKFFWILFKLVNMLIRLCRIYI